MKKFYIPIFTAVFLLTSFFSQGQVFNSITSNPNNYTLDDPRFWVGGAAFQPGNPCTGCTINIFTDVTMVQEGGGTTSQTPGADGPFLNDVVITNGTLNLYGVSTLTINTYVQFINSKITLGNEPFNTEVIKLNDQIDLDATSSVILANNFTIINANDTSTAAISPIQGPHDDLGNPGTKSPGIFAVYAAPFQGSTYSQTLNQNGIGTLLNSFSNYTLNCFPDVPAAPVPCGAGFIFGPAATSLDATFGVIFMQSTTLPVILVQFTANKNSDGSVLVSWATSQEQNSSYYDVERSGDQAAWTKLGSVKAKGFSSTTSNYSFADKLPLDGTGYYRLKMVDLDGKFTYSKAVPVNSGEDAQALVIYSNPFSDQIRLKVNVSRPQMLTMTVSDMLGKTYISQSYHAQQGDNMVNLQPSISASGMYILRIQGDSYDQTVKLEKQ